MISPSTLRKWVKYNTDWFGRISTWQRFAKEVRFKQENLLVDLPRYKDSILVAGCQRSGTTAVSRLLTSSEGLSNFWSRDDEELDAAVILSGREKLDQQARYCFQTTYLNERFIEYKAHAERFRLIWIIRNPYSVCYSFLYNWEQFALDELFESCGKEWWASHRKGSADSNLEKACASYNAKMAQLDRLHIELPAESLYLIDYDEFVSHKHTAIPALYDFVGLEYKPDYAEHIRSSSLDKAKQLSERERAVIGELCDPLYSAALDQACRDARVSL